MRILSASYLIVSAIMLGVLVLMQLPGVLIVFLYFTMGIGYVLVYPILKLGFWILLFVPAAIGARFDWRIGLLHPCRVFPGVTHDLDALGKGRQHPCGQDVPHPGKKLGRHFP